MPIVEGTLLLAVGATLLLDPIRGVVANVLVAGELADRPTPRKINDGNGNELEFFVEDFVDQDKGELHTNFLIGTVERADGEKVCVVLTKAEVEMMKQAAFLDAALKNSIPVGPDALEKIRDTVRERVREIARAKSRKVKVRKAKKSARARKAEQRLSRRR